MNPGDDARCVMPGFHTTSAAAGQAPAAAGAPTASPPCRPQVKDERAGEAGHASIPGLWSWIFLFVLALLASPAMAAGRTLDVRLAASAPVALSAYFAVLEDPGQQLTLTEVLAAPEKFSTASPDAAVLSHGFTRSAYWLRLSLRNAGDRPVDLLLDLGTRPSHVEFHYPVGDGTYRSLTTGMALPFASRPYPNRLFVFPIELPPHTEAVYYLRLQSTNSLIVPAKLWSAQAFQGYERDDYFAQAAYFGMATAMALFNLLLFFTLGDLIYLSYVGLVLAMELTLAAQTGLGQEFLWTTASVWSNISTFVGYSLLLASALAFTRQMLNTRAVLPKLDRHLRILVVFFLFFPVCFVLSAQVFMKWAMPLYGCGLLVMVGTALLCACQRQRSAYLFLLAFSLSSVGGMLILLRAIGLAPTNALTLNGLQFGSALEMLLLAIALADRVNTARREKEEAQHEALNAQQLLVANLQASESLLEERVLQRTAELISSKARLESTLSDLVKTQAELIESEKKASLGERVANEALIAADEANRAKSDFLARISHDLRAPLTAIIGYAEMIATTAGSEAHNGRIIRRSAQHLLALINDLIDYARGGADANALQPASLYTAALLDSIVADAVSLAHRNGNSFDYQVVAPLPPVITADARRLRQILENLLVNAAKFTRNGQLEFRVETRVDADADGVAIFVFTVRDTGPGIAADELAKIFEPFQRLKGAENHEGLGLGLAIARQWVDRMHGAIEASSVAGQGTTMRVSIPLQLSCEDAIPQRHLTLDELSLPEVDGSGHLIWIVEDSHVIRSLLCSELSGLGFEVVPFANGQEAIGHIGVAGKRLRT